MGGMLSKADAKLVHALKNRRGREKHGLFAAEGIRVVEELLGSSADLRFAIVSTSLGDTARGAHLLAALQGRIPVHSVPDHELTAHADTDTPQGVVAVAAIPNLGIEDISLTARSLVLVLDAVQDPGNLGTLIRNADAFGADAVIALTGTTDFWSSKVVRAAAGSAFRMRLVNAAPDAAWTWLERNRFELCGADMAGEAVGDATLPDRNALVLGNEGSGLREETRARLARTLSIPMRGPAESLNVAVAAGILLYELSRRG